jgi:molecular chaperone GrpE (heat shock protein)
VTEPQPRRRRDRHSRWFPGSDSSGPDDAATTGLPGLAGPATGSPTALSTAATLTSSPDSQRAVSNGVDVTGPRGGSGLPGMSSRPGAIDGLPPFVESGPYESYDPYKPAEPQSGPDWASAPSRGQAPPQGSADRPSGPQAGLEAGPPTPPPLSGDPAEQLAALARRVDELTRLRRHDVELVDRLHEENGKLRQGELTEAMGPLLRGLIRLHDQMTSLGADDPQSVAGILRQQLLQVLDIAADVRPYIAVPGSPFDPARHLALRGVGTDDAARDRTVARGVRPGFVRGTSTVLRPAEAEVYRHR